MPPIIDAFIDRIRTAFPEVALDLTAPSGPQGSYFIDLREASWGFPVSWREDVGFGFYTDPQDGYGDKPTETYAEPLLAARRAAILIRECQLGRAPRPMRLSDLRELRNVTQDGLAKRMQKSQAAISKLEARSEVQVGTLCSTVAALGGHVDIRVVFDDMEATLTRFGEPEDDTPPRKPGGL